MSIAWSKDPYGRVTLTAPAGSNHVWSKSRDGGDTWFEMPLSKYNGSVIVDNRPIFDWGSYATDYSSYHDLDSTNHPVPVFAASYSDLIRYRCVVDGTEYHTSDINVRPDRQGAVNAQIDWILNFPTTEWYRGLYERYTMNAPDYALDTLTGMYLMATEPARKAHILSHIQAAFDAGVTAVDSENGGRYNPDTHYPHGCYVAYKALKTVDPTLAAQLFARINDMATQLMTHLGNKVWTGPPWASYSPNWLTGPLAFMACLYTDADFPLWFNNQTMKAKLINDLDFIATGHGINPLTGALPYTMNPNPDPSTFSSGEISYGGIVYQELKQCSINLNWRPDLLALTEQWWAYGEQAVEEPHFYNYFNPNNYQTNAVSFYAQIQQVTVLQRLNALWCSGREVPEDFVEAMYSAAFDADGYAFDYYSSEDDATSIGYKPEGFLVDDPTTTGGSVDLGPPNWYLFYAVPGLLLTGVNPAIWAWEGLSRPGELRTINQDGALNLSFAPVFKASAYRMYRNGTRWPDSSAEFATTSIPITGTVSGDTWNVSAVVDGTESAQSAGLVVELTTPPPHHLAKGGSIHLTKGGSVKLK